jgi:Holliday junction resolvase-like predicted endonuclease
VGATRETAEARPFQEVGGEIDAVAATGATAVYVEVMAVPGQRKPRG